MKSPFWDLPFSKQQKKESENYITRLADGYQNSPFIKSIIKLVSEEANKSERLLPQIELFRDSFIISSVKVGKLSKRKIVYNDLEYNLVENFLDIDEEYNLKEPIQFNLKCINNITDIAGCFMNVIHFPLCLIYQTGIL